MQSPEDARRIAEQLVERGIGAGATAADALYAGDRSSSVQVRLGGMVGRHLVLLPALLPEPEPPPLPVLVVVLDPERDGVD